MTLNADSTYEVFAVRYSTRTATRSELFHGYPLYGEPDADTPFDYFFWVARNASRTVVIDCGYEATVGVRRKRPLTITPADALAEFGIAVADVPQLIVTHAHFDHIGNVPDFSAAEIIMSRSELDFWRGAYGQHLQFKAFVEPNEVEHLVSAAEAGRVTAIGTQHSPAPGIETVVVGGHTPGQAVVIVSTADGPCVLASDAVHLYEEIERDRPFHVASDLLGMYRAFDQLREMLESPGAVLVPGHDPEVMRRFPAASGNLSDLAVRIK
ncbi:N-acyl homoserine lactonase family protein [Streptomyces prunicolor]|uniref:N-acyl homoserine lactonase family protein n=1 Tax=Streptomyces prunicolor TaxID=67348 RepID=UPI0003A5AEE9|nr:N-acyl homoserine lactonase family protein [Streptomyces prunicolor]